MNKITRYADIELRVADEPESRGVQGLAAVFNKDADLGWFTEEVDSRAFDDADMSDVILNFNHDNNIVLAGTRNGTLKLNVREDGLYQESSIVGTSQGNDILTLVREGLINKMSFAFTIDDDKWETKDGKDHRIITKIGRLYDVSLVTFPAYPQTSAGLRSADELDELAKEHFKRAEQDKKMGELDDEFKRHFI